VEVEDEVVLVGVGVDVVVDVAVGFLAGLFLCATKAVLLSMTVPRAVSAWVVLPVVLNSAGPAARAISSAPATASGTRRVSLMDRVRETDRSGREHRRWGRRCIDVRTSGRAAVAAGDGNPGDAH
jgi:hypothetical protein